MKTLSEKVNLLELNVKSIDLQKTELLQEINNLKSSVKDIVP